MRGAVAHYGRKSRAAEVPRLSFDVYRKAHVIAKALHIVQKTLLSNPEGSQSDAEDMQEILMMHYHHTWNCLQYDDDMREAIALGFEPRGLTTAMDLIAFLSSEKGQKSESKSLNPIRRRRSYGQRK